MRLLHVPLVLVSLALVTPGCVKGQKHVTLKPDPVQTATDPDRVALETTVANRYMKAQQPGEILARLRIATQGQSDGKRPPANVALVMDTSSSMKGEAIDEAKLAALALLDALGDGDTLSVIVFGSRTSTLVPAVMLDAGSRAMIRAAIAKIEAHGTTDLAGGLSAGQLELAKAHGNGVEMLHRMVLLSDGVPNDATPIPAIALQIASLGAPITALGLGLDYHETLLAEVAQTTGGTFHFVEDASAVAQVFADEVLDLEKIVARSVQLDLRPGPGVAITEVVGHGQSGSSGHVYVPLGDLYEGQVHEVLVRLQVGEHRAGATVELLDAGVTFVDATTASGHSFARDAFLSVEATDDAAEIAAGRDPELEQAAMHMQTAAATLQIMSLARSGQLDPAKAELKRVRARAEENVKKTDDAELAKMVKDLDMLEATLPELVPVPQPTAVKTAVGAGTQNVGAKGSGSPQAQAEMMSSGDPMPMPKSSARHNRATHSRAYQKIHGRR